MEPGLGEAVHSDPLWSADADLAAELSDELGARVKRELEPGERLLWAASSCTRPVPLAAKFFLGCAAVPLLLALAAAAFANGFGFLGTPPPHNEAAPVMMGIILFTGACMLAAGLSITWVNRLVEMRRMSEACYAVTDRRAILWVPDTKTDAVRVLSVFRGQIEGVVRAELPDGSANIELTCTTYRGYHPWHPFGFRDVPDVRRVEQIVRNNLVSNDWSRKPHDRESR